MEENTIKLYARTNENHVVTKLLETIHNADEILDTDILIGEGYGDNFAHTHTRYTLSDGNNCANYKIVSGEMVERTAEEKQAEIDNRPPPQKTEAEKLQATIFTLESAVAMLAYGGTQ